MKHFRNSLTLVIALVVADIVAFGKVKNPEESPVTYTVAVQQPASKGFQVSLTANVPPGPLLLRIPNSRRGDPRLQGYARFITHFKAADNRGATLPWERVDGQTWKVSIPSGGAVLRVDYGVAINQRELLRFDWNWIDENGGYADMTSLLLGLPQFPDWPTVVRLELPAGWTSATGLREAGNGAFQAHDYSELVDSPVEFGHLRERSIYTSGVRVRLIFPRELPQYDETVFDANVKKIVDAEIGLFHTAPFTTYTALFLWRPDLDFGGGIEHASGVVMNIGSKWMMNLPRQFAGTFAHELFHAWNAEAIHPRALDHWDYTKENYSTLLWFVEGMSNYYAALTLWRTGIQSTENFFPAVSRTIEQFENDSAHGYVSLADASIATWISPVEDLDIYSGGEVVGFITDLQIRSDTANERCLDDVMRALFEQSRRPGYAGYTEEDIQSVVDRTGAHQAAATLIDLSHRNATFNYDQLLSGTGIQVRIFNSEDSLHKVSVTARPDATSQQEQTIRGLLGID